MLHAYFFTYDSLPAIASAQARRAGQNRFIFDREEDSLWLNFFDLVGNFRMGREESDRILTERWMSRKQNSYSSLAQ